MKKQSIFTIVTLVAIFVMASCGKYEAKKVSLNSQNDSLNYTLGLANGAVIKDYYMKNDSSDKPIAVLMKAIEEAYKTDAPKDEMYKLGLQIGSSFKQNKTKGLMGDSTMTFNEKLVIQGLVNALNGFEEGMKPADAEKFIQETMMAKQQAQMSQQAPPAPAAPADSTAAAK
jgi:FKBP-type peptidyl-prolyl cis-trans isomerase FklB